MAVYEKTIPEEAAGFYETNPGGYVQKQIEELRDWEKLKPSAQQALLAVWNEEAPNNEAAPVEIDKTIENLIHVGETADNLREYVAFTRAAAKDIAVDLLGKWSESDATQPRTVGDTTTTNLGALQAATGQSWRTILLWVSETVKIGVFPTTPKAGAVDPAVWKLIHKYAKEKAA